MAVRRALLAASALLACSQVEAKPLVSKDLISDTYALLQSAYTEAYSKAGVDALLAQVPVGVLQAEIDKQMKQLPPVPPNVLEGIAEAKVKALMVKSMAVEYSIVAQQKADELSKTVVTALETNVPALKGSIGPGPANLALFLVYSIAVVYIILKVVLFVLRTVLGIFCFCCCCGCCRGGKKAPAEDGKKAKPKAEAKPKAAAVSNGKKSPAKK